MKTDFTNPLTYAALQAFTRPRPGHRYEHPVMLPGGDAAACNGNVAIRCHRGLWCSEDFPPAHPGFAEAFAKIPLDLFPSAAEFHKLHDFRPLINRRGIIAPFDRTGAFAATPGVRLERLMVPLSMLQLVARLPHCEFTLAETSAVTPALFFRFSGGLGAIAALKHTTAAFTITPDRRYYDGTPVTKSTVGQMPFKNWPPVDTSDC